MGILLGILAVIGKILFAVLCLFLLLLVIFLAVPIRYRAQGTYRDKAGNGSAEVTWLFGLIRLQVQSDKDPSRSLLVAGHDLLHKPEQKKMQKSAKKAGPKRKKAAADSSPVRQKAKTTDHTQSAVDRPSKSPETEPESAAAKRDREALESILPAPQTSTGHAPALPADFLDEPSDEEKEPSESGLKRLLKCLFSEENAGVLRKLLKALLGILGEIAPRRGHAFIRFGFDDPALTGNLAAMLAVLYPAFGGNLEAEPVFDREALEAEGNIAGRLHLAVPVYYVVRLLLDRQVRSLISQIRKE